MSVTAQQFSGVTTFSVNALAGDQIFVNAFGTILDDLFTGSPNFSLRIEGDIVTGTYAGTTAVGGGLSLPMSLSYVYDVPEDMEVNFELVSGEDYGIEEANASLILVSNDVVEVSNPALNLGIGFGFFLLVMFFITWFFRSRKNV